MNSINIDFLNESLKEKGLTLEYASDGLVLTHPEFLPIRVDFLNSKIQYRTSHGALGEMVAKACGAKHKPSVLDLTAGLGRDSFLLASLGCQVQMVERNPVMHALLLDGLERLNQIQADVSLKLIFLNSLHLTSNQLMHNRVPEVIYIDPMHPERSKSALVKKDMRILRALVGDDIDKEVLLEYAFSLKGAKKVVVKWPLKAPLPISRKPTGSIKGKSTRFDIFQL